MNALRDAEYRGKVMSAKTVLADTLTPDQIEIESLIKKMYSIDPDTFEAKEFGGKYKNGVRLVEGKYDPDRQCKLLEEYLVKEAVIKVKRAKQGCMTGNEGYFRYPHLNSTDLISYTRVELPPKPQIKIPTVDSEKGKIQVVFPKTGANVVYYLRKQAEGWRIYRVESSHNSATIESLDEKSGDSIDIFPPEMPTN